MTFLNDVYEALVKLIALTYTFSFFILYDSDTAHWKNEKKKTKKNINLKKRAYRISYMFYMDKLKMFVKKSERSEKPNYKSTRIQQVAEDGI